MVQQGRELHLLTPSCCFTYTLQPACLAFPTLRPARVRLFRLLLGQRPSLHNLLGPSLAFVRLLRRYYDAVRLPADAHLGLIAHRLLPSSLRVSGSGPQQGLSVLAREVSMHAWGLRLRLACDALAMAHVTVLPSGWPDTVGAIVLRISAFSEFINIRDTQPTYARGSKRFKCALCFATPSH